MDEHGSLVRVEILVPARLALQRHQHTALDVGPAPAHVAVEALFVGEDADPVALRVVDLPGALAGRALLLVEHLAVAGRAVLARAAGLARLAFVTRPAAAAALVAAPPDGAAPGL